MGFSSVRPSSAQLSLFRSLGMQVSGSNPWFCRKKITRLGLPGV
jgi:hypothetical protein